MRLIRMLNQKDVSYVLAIDFGDPTPFASRIEIGDKFGNDIRHQGFERVVPSVLLRIPQAFSMDNPAHVSHAMRAQDVWYAAPVCLMSRSSMDRMQWMSSARPVGGRPWSTARACSSESSFNFLNTDLPRVVSISSA